MITLGSPAPVEHWFPKLPDVVARGVKIGFIEPEAEAKFKARYAKIEKTIDGAQQAVALASEAIAIHDKATAELIARENAIRESLVQEEIAAKERIMALRDDAEKFAATFVKFMRDGSNV